MAGEMNPIGDEYPELYQHLAAIVAEKAEHLGVEGERAKTLARYVAEQFRIDFGGQSLYVPKVAGAVHEELYEAWRKGADIKELARRFSYSEPHVNLIIRLMRKRASRHQKGLFDGLDPGFPPA